MAARKHPGGGRKPRGDGAGVVVAVRLSPAELVVLDAVCGSRGEAVRKLLAYWTATVRSNAEPFTM